MRIGIITGEYPPMQGGVGAYTEILSREVARRRNQVFVLSRVGTQNTSREGLKSADARLEITANIDHWGLGSLIAARQWARSLRLDLVNLQYQTAAFSMSPYIHFLPDALRPIPLVTTFHDLRFPYLFPKAGRLRPWIVMRLARASAGAIATNHEDAQKLAGLCSRLIPIGSNIAPAQNVNRAEWRTKAGATQGDFLIVYFGLINRSKGLETLLESVARLTDLPLRLALVGAVAGSSDPSNTAYMQEIDKLIDRLGIASRIHRTGFLADDAVSGYLASADVIALPFNDGASFRRGTLMAALEHVCAIVTTQPTIPIPEFVDGENMRLVPPRDPIALADALHRLSKSSDERVILRHGAAMLARRFDWTEIAQETIAFYQHVLGAKA